jgi:hypothetical protein
MDLELYRAFRGKNPSLGNSASRASGYCAQATCADLAGAMPV